MTVKRYLLPAVTFVLGFLLCLSFFLLRDFRKNFDQGFQYTFSGQYSNEEYGFAFGNIPEGWTVKQVEPSFTTNDVTQFLWSSSIPGANFSVFVSDHELERSDIAYLGKSTERYYYYSFLRYPFECSYYSSPVEFEIRGQCEMTEDVWDDVRYGVIPSFQLTGY